MTEGELEFLFKYHPPTTPERIAAHQAINESALSFAKAILANVKNERLRDAALDFVQQSRMFANQGITMDDVLKAQSPEH